MLKHCVFATLKPDVPMSDVVSVMRALGALVHDVDGMQDFTHGPNRDYESKSPDFGYGFVATFRDRAALATYDALPRHKELGAALAALCVNGAAGIIVFDLEIDAS